MSPLAGEFIGTMLLVLLGNGVVANVVLNQTKGNNGGWIVITFGWGMAVFVAVSCTAAASGAHLNPAVTIGLLAAGKFTGPAAGYILAQFAGAMLGALLVYLTYMSHYLVTADGDAKLATFSTGPAIRNTAANLFTETLGTFVLVFAVLMAEPPSYGPAKEALGLGALARRTRGTVGPRHRFIVGGHHRLRDQPRARPRPTNHSCDSVVPQQAR